MAIKLYFLLQLVAIASLIQQQGQAASIEDRENVVDNNSPDYWYKRREEFFKNTTINLSQQSIGLLKTNHHTPLKFNGTVHLPFWFDYELFRKVFNKTDDYELERHFLYIKTCVRTLKERLLIRITHPSSVQEDLATAQDSTIDSDADLTYEESFEQAIKASQLRGGEQQQQQNTLNDNNDVVEDFDLDEGRNLEGPIEFAKRVVSEELERVKSLNQLRNYLELLSNALSIRFKEYGESAIFMAKKLPY